MQYIGMLKQTINTSKIMIKKVKSSYLMYLNANNLYGWAMSQKLAVDGFKWIKKLSKIINLHNDLPFLPERKKIKNATSLFGTYLTKKTMLFT